MIFVDTSQEWCYIGFIKKREESRWCESNECWYFAEISTRKSTENSSTSTLWVVHLSRVDFSSVDFIHSTLPLLWNAWFHPQSWRARLWVMSFECNVYHRQLRAEICRWFLTSLPIYTRVLHFSFIEPLICFGSSVTHCCAGTSILTTMLLPSCLSPPRSFDLPSRSHHRAAALLYK